MAVKTIKIGNNEYDMKASAYTMFAYKDQIGRDYLKDIKRIVDIEKEIKKLPEEEQTFAWLENLQDILDIALQLAYIMIKEQNSTTKEYKEWLKEIESMNGSETGWISEVIQLAMSPLRGRIQSSQN